MSKDYAEEEYLTIVTESGIRAAILSDCLFRPGTKKLIVPQHYSQTLSVRGVNRKEEFSRSDGLFAEVTKTDNDRFWVRFPFKYPITFKGDCGNCKANELETTEGYILLEEIDMELARVLMPVYYSKTEVLRFKLRSSKTDDLVKWLTKCMDGNIFPKVGAGMAKKLVENSKKFYDFLTGCELEAEADISLRTEIFGAGGGVTLSYKIKPKDRKISIALYSLENLSGIRDSGFMVIKRLECKEGKAVKLKRLCMVDLTNRKCYDLIEEELTKGTDLKHVPKGDTPSRTCMVNIREHSGHDDVFKLYRFILKSKDFRQFAAIQRTGFDYRHIKVRAYLDFLVRQVADFRR